jgi:hypothetical protein
MGKQENAPVFDVADLIQSARQTFGVTPEVMTGALYGVTDQLTIDDAGKKLKEFMTRPIK